MAERKSEKLDVITLAVEASVNVCREDRQDKDQARREALRFWPKDKPLPWAYDRRRPAPCPECRRLRMDDLGVACVRIMSFEGIVKLRCKACGAKFDLSREGAEGEALEDAGEDIETG